MPERFRGRFPALVYYGGLIRRLPAVFREALTTVGHLSTAVIIVATVIGGVVLSVVQANGWWIAAAFLVLVAVGVLRANYDVVENVQGDLDDLRWQLGLTQIRDLIDVMHHLDQGIAAIVDQTNRPTDFPVKADISNAMDRFDTDVEERLQGIAEPTETRTYTKTIAEPTLPDEFYERQHAIAKIKQQRLIDLRHRIMGRLRSVEDERRARRGKHPVADDEI